jgi:hypothetical protein
MSLRQQEQACVVAAGNPTRGHALISETAREVIKSKLRDAEAELRLIIKEEHVDEFTSSDLRGVIKYIQEIIAKL